MPITERIVDKKHRVTLPSDGDLEEGTKVTIVSSEDTVLITKNPRLASKFKALMPEIEMKRKFDALDEWENLLKEAGVIGMSSRKIEDSVGRAIVTERHRARKSVHAR